MGVQRAPWVGVFWLGMVLLLFLFWGMALSSCALWKTMSTQQKEQSIINYYQAFSDGLKIASSLFPAEKQAPAIAALDVVDQAISRLDNAYKASVDSGMTKQLEIETQSKVETANAVVGAM